MTLDKIVEQLKENKQSTDNTTEAVVALKSSFDRYILNIERTSLQAREREIEAAQAGPGGGRIIPVEERQDKERQRSGVLDFFKSMLPAGIGGALGGMLAGGGILAGIVGLAALGLIDASKMKTNVETLLSIGERYNENTLSQLAADGAVIVGLYTLGKALIPFAIGGGLNAGVDYFSKGNWAQNVKDNVATLLSIGTITGVAQAAQLLFSGAAVPLALKGLGIGLIAFGAGQGIVGLGQWATDASWAQQVKDNVLTLLSIADGLTGNVGMLLESAVFVPAMTGLALGLSVFAVGQAATGLAQFITSNGWAQQVKDNVVTLLSIKDELGGNWELLKSGGAFGLAMTGIGAGLAAFGGGALLAGGTDMLADWFSTGTDWAQQVVDNVTTLLSISSLPGIGGDTAAFAAAMTGIGAGLVAFSVGAGAASVTDAIADWITEGEGRQSWAQQVKDNVTTLLSVTKEADEGQATQFVKAMGQISAGLLAFSTSNFVGALEGAGAAIIDFFFGDSSPFSQIKTVAQEADNLEKGATAVEKLTVSLEKLGQLKFDGSKINMTKFAQDLKESVPIIEAAIMGEEGGLIFGTTIRGLASPDVDYNTAIKNITGLRSALSAESGNIQSGSSNNDLRRAQINIQSAAIRAERLSTLSESASNAGGAAAPVIIQDNRQDNRSRSSNNTFQGTNSPASRDTDWYMRQGMLPPAIGGGPR